MKVLNKLRQESDLSLKLLLFLAGTSGLSNALVLAIINAATKKITEDEGSLRYLLLFIVVLAIFITTQKRLMVTAIAEVERVLNRIRIRLADKIRRADLASIEKIGRSEIYAGIQKDTLTISQGAMSLVFATQSLILGTFTIIYIAILSRTAIILVVLTGAFSIASFLRRRRRLNQDLHDALTQENRLFDSLTHFLDGFKEVKMSRARNEDLFESTRTVSQSATELKVSTQTQFALLSLFSQTAWYFGIGAVVFVLPQLSETYTDVVVQVTTAILFAIGPINAVVGSFPSLANAQVAIENIYGLEADLDRAAQPLPESPRAFRTFREIRFDQAVFTFQDPEVDRPFTVGPIDLTLEAGELTIIAGGNGTGKSTFLKLLTGLYFPQRGNILLDGTVLDDTNYHAYRELFSAIFADYHLFDRLYGFREVDRGRVAELLAELGLAEKTSLIDGEFETLDLSGGQRKRLALLVSLLEDKPIYVFDEVAADQDPDFKRTYYTDILQRLKARGKTVIAVSHDDQYFNVGDRLIRMFDGKIRSIEYPQ